jgi:hypothetical protein
MSAPEDATVNLDRGYDSAKRTVQAYPAAEALLAQGRLVERGG